MAYGYGVPMEPEETVDEAQMKAVAAPSILDLIQEQCGEAAREAFAMYLALDNDDILAISTVTGAGASVGEGVGIGVGVGVARKIFC